MEQVPLLPPPTAPPQPPSPGRASIRKKRKTDKGITLLIRGKFARGKWERLTSDKPQQSKCRNAFSNIQSPFKSRMDVNEIGTLPLVRLTVFANLYSKIILPYIQKTEYISNTCLKGLVTICVRFADYCSLRCS